MINATPRVRFAPSPTGYLHVGGLRTALYNYLFAKHNNGEFILRIEDTDRNRLVEGAVENLIETINWTGLEYSEGPDKPGKYGPYTQSERLDIYGKYADQLIEEGKAYKCFCTPERLTELREEQQRQKLPQAKYDKKCLSLTKEEVEKNIADGLPYVVRMNIEPGPKVMFDDIVRNRVEFDRSTIDDQVLIKGDGFPTYHMANVVDDHLMKITHVIRGEEWLSSTPKHVLLYEYLGWEIPEFAHLPLLLNPDKSKLSKRQGDVAVEDYKEKGYFKEALNNFVALLGWSTSDNQEFFELEELVEKFTLDRVHKAGAVFNIEKLNWLNAEHLRKKSSEELLGMLKKELAESKYKDLELSDAFLLEIIEAMRERVSFVKGFYEDCPYFYEDVNEYEEKVITKSWKENTPDVLNKFIEEIEKYEKPTAEEYETALNNTVEALEIGKGKIMPQARVAVSGVGGGPHLYEILVILGKEKVIARINTAIEKLS